MKSGVFHQKTIKNNRLSSSFFPYAIEFTNKQLQGSFCLTWVLDVFTSHTHTHTQTHTHRGQVEIQQTIAGKTGLMVRKSLFLVLSVMSTQEIWASYLWFWRRQWSPPQYSYLETPMDRGAWWAAVHGVSESRTRLSDFTFTFHFPALEKEMATHSSVLAWRIPGTGEPGGLPSVGSHRVGHDWSDLAAAAALVILSLRSLLFHIKILFWLLDYLKNI